MKLTSGDSAETAIRKLEIHLPFGLIGLPKLQRFSLSPIKGSPPFLLMRAISEERFDFIVIEPAGLVPKYVLELSDDDAETLQLASAEDAQVLNIITVHSLRPQYVTVNLVGPVVLNRKTLIGKQVILANAQAYTTHYVLVDEREREAQRTGRGPC
jgi:flagellar assembly factor FliW